MLPGQVRKYQRPWESILHIDSDCFENTHLHLNTNFTNFKQKVCQKHY